MNAPAGSARADAAAPTEAPVCHDTDLVGTEATSAAMIETIQIAARDRLVPLNVSLELTLNCNIRCLHCYNFDRDGKPAVAPADAAPPLAPQEILDLLADLRAAGCLFLSLTGGEVLTYPHLFAVLDRARELRLAVQLLTNGTLLRPGVAARLARYPNLLGVSISVYGATAAVHDGITQVAGSWRRTWDGALRLRAAGIAVRIKIIVMRGNAHEVAAMRAAADGHGLPYLVDLTITPRHDGSRGSLATRVDDDQLAALYRGPLRDLVPAVHGDGDAMTEARFACNCARGNCAISVGGDVYPCLSVPWPAGNVRRQRFADIWRTSPVFERIRGLRMADFPACGPCADKAFCSRNRGAAYTYSGSYTGADPFVCQSAALTRVVAAEKAHAAPVEPPGAESPTANGAGVAAAD